MIRNVDNSTMFRSAPSAAAKRAAPAVTIWAVVVVFPKNEGDGVWKPTVMNNAMQPMQSSKSRLTTTTASQIGNLLGNPHHDVRGEHEQLVRDGVEHGAQFRHFAAPSCNIAVHSVRHARDDEDGQSDSRLFVGEAHHENGDQENPDQRDLGRQR